MDPFLDRVASVYLANELKNLGEYCFVFPNKRSGTFFRHFLMSRGKNKSFIMPEIQTVSEFVTGFSPLVEASRYEQLFILYNEYKKLSAEIADFDKFLFWGEMLISDFNDVDRYLVDPAALFKNVHDLKEINSTYLTDDQREIVRRFWNDEQPQDHITDFWKHVRHGEDGKEHPSQEKFLKLWEILYPLFTGFKATLRRRGLSTSGMYYRNAVDMLDPMNDTELPFKRYIFVGFNVLSTSELKIFRLLQKRQAADFYWDFNSPAFDLRHNRATRFISANVKEFKPLYPLGEAKITDFPKIDIIGIPSNVGQAKMTGEILTEWLSDGILTDPANSVDTAVVLPDESLFIPVMQSVPEKVGEPNVTMGLPLRNTPIASVLRSITSMQMRARMIRGRIHFFYEDVRSLLSQPLIKTLAPKECDDILKDIHDNRRIMLDGRQLADTYSGLAPLFEPVKEAQTLRGAYEYLHRLFAFFISGVLAEEAERPETDESSDDSDIRLRLHFLQTADAALESLYHAASQYAVEMRHGTFFHLMERALGSDTVNFVGEPLKGLQIMGVLETRSLDFRNIVMLSMNERVFPRKQYTASFIPDTLRRGFGMATMDFQESIFAYYFYRLISRASNVKLLYDARKVGGKSTEMSRYLSQLLYVYNSGDNIHHSLGVYSSNFFEPRPIVIQKTPEVMRKLERFTIPAGEDRKFLSASALNTYLNCPLNFYLQYVEDYREESEITEYMDSSTFGTIVHAVAQKIYQNIGSRPANVTVTRDMLRSFLDKKDTRLGRYITEEVNRRYLNLKEDTNRKLTGESLVLGRIIEKCIRDMLRYEAEDNDVFTFIEAEYLKEVRYPVTPSLTVNVRMIIDRVDRLSNGSLRFIDYKTGGDSYTAKTVSHTVTGEVSNREKAIFQLLFYCNTYKVLMGYDCAIQPMVYAFRKMAVDRGISPVAIEGKEITDYRSVNEEFVALLNARIEEIFDASKPFKQANDDEACKYCQFQAVCGRFPDDRRN